MADRIIGWTIWDYADDCPYTPMRGKAWYAKRKPITVYRTEAVAASQVKQPGLNTNRYGPRAVSVS